MTTIIFVDCFFYYSQWDYTGIQNETKTNESFIFVKSSKQMGKRKKNQLIQHTHRMKIKRNKHSHTYFSEVVLAFIFNSKPTN